MSQLVTDYAQLVPERGYRPLPIVKGEAEIAEPFSQDSQLCLRIRRPIDARHFASNNVQLLQDGCPRQAIQMRGKRCRNDRVKSLGQVDESSVN